MAKHTFLKQTKHTEITWSQLFGYKWGYNLQASQSESLVCIQGLRVILNFRKDRSTRTQVIAIIALLRRYHCVHRRTKKKPTDSYHTIRPQYWCSRIKKQMFSSTCIAYKSYYRYVSMTYIGKILKRMFRSICRYIFQ